MPSDDLLPRLQAAADALAAVEADSHLDSITDIRLLVHVAAGRIKNEWTWFQTGRPLARRGYRLPLVWAAAYLAVESGQVTTRHQLAKGALAIGDMPDLQAGVEIHAQRAVEIAEHRLARGR